MTTEYRKKLMEKYKKRGVKFNKETGLPLQMKQIFEDDKELFIDLQNDYFTSGGTMDEGKIDLKAMIKKVKEKMKGKRKLQSGDDLIKETEKRIKNNGR